MKAIVKVSHLQMDDARYDRGDVIDVSEERIKQLGSSVEAVITINKEPKVPEVVSGVKNENVEKSPKRGRKPGGK